MCILEGWNNNPSAGQFQAIFRCLMVRCGAFPSTSGNVAAQDETVSLSAVEMSSTPAAAEEEMPSPFANIPAIVCDHSYLPTHFGGLVENALVYISGSVERAARLAVTYINEDRKEGYKFSLNRINNVYVHEQKVSGRCKTIVYSKPDGSSVLYNYDCNLIPDQPDAVHRVCPKCPLLIDVKSPAAIQAAGILLKKYNEESHLRNYFSIDQITRASTQNKPKEAYFVEFTIRDTECLKQDESVDDLKCRKTSSDSGGIGNTENKGNVTNDGQEADTQRGKRRDKKHKVQSPKFTHLKATPTSVPDLQPESSESKSESEEQEGVLPIEASASTPLPVTSKRLKQQSSPESAASLPKTGPVFLTNFPEAPSTIHTCPGVFRHVTL
ncbi:FETUB protein, partial [Polypterus senegalus]